jgi:hypothetical protein
MDGFNKGLVELKDPVHVARLRGKELADFEAAANA